MAKFSRTEFACKCGCGENKISDLFMRKINELGALVPFPVKVSSGYRCPAYNSKVSTTGSNGPHTTGEAGDFAVSHAEAYQFLMAATRVGFSGIGVNQKGSGRFIHLDCLPNSAHHPRPRLWSY